MKAAVVRFPAAIGPGQPLRTSALLEPLRRWAASRQSEASPAPERAPLRGDESLDLDERVRLVGEW